MWREITYTLPGPGRVDAHLGGLTIQTDHPPEAEAGERPPTPWCLFLASIGTCMASFVAAWCEERDLDAGGITLVQRQDLTEDETLPAFTVEIRAPEGFPEDHLAGLVVAAEECTVKRVIEAGPRFLVRALSAGRTGSPGPGAVRPDSPTVVHRHARQVDSGPPSRPG